MRTMNLKQTLTALAAVLMAVSLIATPAVAAGAGSTIQPLTLGVDVGAPNAPNDVVRYGTESQPGVIVELETSEDVDALREWTNGSDDRIYVESYPSTNASLISVPPGDVKAPLGQGWLRSNTLTDLGYVEGWSWDRQVSYSEPIRFLDEDSEFQKPAGAFYAEVRTSGEYTPGQMAWSEDAPDSNLTHARELVGADTVTEDGTGVDIAVIDSGVNFGNGTLYGDGTEGSTMRVTDAYDFVESEEPNLSVDRANMTRELALMDDPNGHGSWVSSASVNAKTGIAPNASLMAYRALNAEGEGSTSDIRRAIERANTEGADILIMSLGSPMWSDGMADALEYSLSEDGNVTAAFIAVGNSYPMKVASPADVEGVIGVTATNARNASTARKAYFANGGPDDGLTDGSGGATRGVTPDTAAPGMSIQAPVFSAPHADGGVETTERLSGTSMAAPVAGGVGALLLDAKPVLEGDSEAFRDHIVNSGAHTENIGATDSEGGMVNASRAINGYDGSDAPDRDLSSDISARDDANRVMSGDVGVKVSQIMETVF